MQTSASLQFTRAAAGDANDVAPGTNRCRNTATMKRAAGPRAPPHASIRTRALVCAARAPVPERVPARGRRRGARREQAAVVRREQAAVELNARAGRRGTHRRRRARRVAEQLNRVVAHARVDLAGDLEDACTALATPVSTSTGCAVGAAGRRAVRSGRLGHRQAWRRAGDCATRV